MDCRRHERDALQDFALVTTYLPIVGLALRASLLVSALYWSMYTVRMPFASVLMLSASVVYVDSIFMRSQLDKEAGHLSLCALAVLTQQHARQCTDAMSVALCINDLMWSVFASVEVVGHVSTLRTPTSANVKTLIACAFASLHAVLDCFAMDMPQMLSRAVLFYVLCSLVMLCSPFAPKSDRSSCSVLLLCAPVLFVHVYPAVASVVAIVGLHARLVYVSVSKRHVVFPSEASRPCVEQSDLAAKLLAAKKAHGMA